MKEAITGILLISGALLFVGCATEGVPVCGNADLVIPSSELPAVKAKALNGDSTAALQLEQYYDFVVLDYKEGRKWLRLAAEQGNSVAQYDLGLMYMNNDAVPNLGKAKYWFRLAERNGSIEAKEALRKLAIGEPL
jgi:TPR repeat protein